MTPEERKRAIADARQRAETLARAHIRRGARRNSTEIERLRAETATNIIWIAEKRASLVPAEESTEWTQGLKDLWKEHEAKIAAATEAEVAKDNHDFMRGPVREAIDASLAALDLRTEAFNAWRDNHCLAAWLHACDDFATWDKPLGALMAGDDATH